MKIYFAGGTGFKSREIKVLELGKKRLLSFFEINYDKNDQHFHRGAFKLIKG